jgi:hypothetical protein
MEAIHPLGVILAVCEDPDDGFLRAMLQDVLIDAEYPEPAALVPTLPADLWIVYDAFCRFRGVAAWGSAERTHGTLPDGSWKEQVVRHLGSVTMALVFVEGARAICWHLRYPWPARTLSTLLLNEILDSGFACFAPFGWQPQGQVS